MKATDIAILVTLASECRNNNQNTEDSADPNINDNVSYDAGSGSEDGACEQDYVDNNQGVYDPYPGDNTDYPMMSVVDLPTAFLGEDFEGYGHNDLVAGAASNHPSIDVTAGALYAKHLNGSQVWKRGFTDSSVFRMLGIGEYNGLPIRYQDGTASIRVYFDAVHSGSPHYTGAHIFMRYQTEYDLYVASLRLDGKVMIKKKVCGQYTTLASADYSGGSVDVNTWYDLSFEAEGTDLTLSVNGQPELTVSDSDLSWGSTGVRLDYVDVYVDDWTFE